MLSKKTLQQVSVLAASIVGVHGKSLVASEGTPLGELVKACNNQSVFAAPSTPLVAPNGNVVVNGEVTNSLHDDTMDAFIKELGFRVTNFISFAKNSVRPVIDELMQEVMKEMNAIKNPIDDFKITISDMPEPLKDPQFESSFEHFKNASRSSPVAQFKMDSKSPQELLDMLKIGVKSQDEMIQRWAATKGDSFFVSLWDNIFRDPNISKPVVRYDIDGLLVDKSDAEDHYLGIYLIATNLLNNPPSTDVKMTLTQYQLLCNDYIRYAGASIYNYYKGFNTDITIKKIVKSYSVNEKEIIVNAPVYKSWLATGGNNEVLMGLLVSKEKLYLQMYIEEKRVKLINEYSRYISYLKLKFDSEKLIRFKQVLKNSFYRAYNNKTEEEKAITSTIVAHDREVANKLDEFINTVCQRDLDDMAELCTRLVCRVRFYYSDSEEILKGIVNAIKANPNLPVREAATLSAISLVCNFITDQMTLV